MSFHNTSTNHIVHAISISISVTYDTVLCQEDRGVSLMIISKIKKNKKIKTPMNYVCIKRIIK